MGSRFSLRGRETAVFVISLFLLCFLFMGRALWPPGGEAVGGLDVRGLFYPWLTFAREAVRNGRLPLWNGSQFAGFPFLSNPQVGFFYPLNWPALYLPVNVTISWYFLLHLWLGGVGMFLFVRQMRGSAWGAALAGLTFAFSGYAAARVYAGHTVLLATNSWLPWLLLATHWSVVRKRPWAGVVAGAPLALAILAGHITSLIYLGIVWLAFLIYLLVTIRSWWLVARQTLLAGVTGVLISGVTLAPLLQLSLVSARAAEPTLEFASAFSLPPAHLITWLVPVFFGEPTTIGYWSVPNFEELTYYVGVLPLLSIILALKRPSRLSRFYLLLVVLGVLMALGSYGFLFPLAYRLLPPLRLARAPGRAGFLVVFALAALLGEAVTQWQQLPAERCRTEVQNLLRWTLIVILVAGVAALSATGAMFAAQHPTETSGRLWHQLGGWGLAIGLLLAGGVLLWRFLGTDQSRIWPGIGLAALVVADLWLFGAKLVRLESMAPPPLWSDAAAIIGETEARVLPWGVSIFDQNGAGQVGLRSVFGYNALEIGANTALAASVPDPRSTAYDILGAAYVIGYGALDQYTEGERPLTLMAQTANVAVYRRARTLPAARLVSRYEVIADEETAVARVHQPDFDPATTVILNRPPACEAAEGTTAGKVTVTARENGYWRLETDAPAPTLLVISETAYPGWEVTVSGERAEWMTAYTAVRAVCVPAGKQVVEWRFAPTVFAWGGLLSALGLAAVVTAVVLLRRRRRAGLPEVRKGA